MFLDILKAIFGAPARIEALEAKIAELEAKLGSTAHSINLVSPDGTKKIDILCNNTNAGMWVSAGTGKPMVAIYNDEHQGAVVGIWGQANQDGYRRGGLDVAMSHTPETGGTIQMISPQNVLYDIVPGSIGTGTPMNDTRSKF